MREIHSVVPGYQRAKAEYDFDHGKTVYRIVVSQSVEAIQEACELINLISYFRFEDVYTKSFPQQFEMFEFLIFRSELAEKPIIVKVLVIRHQPRSKLNVPVPHY